MKNIKGGIKEGKTKTLTLLLMDIRDNCSK